MKLTQDERAVLESLAVEAHERASTPDGYDTNTAAHAFVTLLDDLERFGQPWVDAYLYKLRVDGAKRYLTFWRTRQRLAARTAKGTKVSLPMYAGKRKRGAYLQTPFDGFDASAIDDQLHRLVATRNTLSKQIQVLAEVKALLEQNPGMTAGEALGRIGRAA